MKTNDTAPAYQGSQLRSWIAITSMMALVACGGGGASADESGTPAPTPSPSPSPSPSPTPTPTPPPPPPTTATLSIATTSGGAVTTAPAGTSCNSSCSATYPTGTAVTLSAQPSTNYKFTGWSGSCNGTALTCNLTLSTATSASATFEPVIPVAGAPFVQFTDALSGPITGGEKGLGGYLSIFGTNFGSPGGLGTTTKVFVGGVEVANYRYLGSAKVGAKLGLQQLTVQVGNLGNAKLGTPLPVEVLVGTAASNTNNTFTPNPGRVLFVSLSGNDATAVADDITHPWRYLQTTSNTTGIAKVLAAGDQVVIRGGNWSDTSADGSWMRFRYTNQEGKAPTGVAGSGWIHFTAYPGPIKGNAIEDVHYSTPAGVRGGFQGANSAYFGTTGDYISISNLRIDVNASATNDAAPINIQYSAGPWRVVNNELGPWPSNIEALAAGVSGHGNGTAVLGNNIHDISSASGSENHGIYADSGASNWSIGYNWVHNISGGNLIQFFDNVGLAGQTYSGFPTGWKGFVGMNIFNNWLDTSGKYGLNLADGTVSASIWNNVIVGSKFSGLRINTTSPSLNLTVAFNTFYDNDRVFSGSGNGQVLNTWGNGNTGTVRVYDNIFAAGPDTVSTSAFYVNDGTDGYMDLKRNLYYDNGYGWGATSKDPLGLYGNPMFTAPTTGNLSLTSGSPAIGQGTQAISISINQDLPGAPRSANIAFDLGAYQHQ